MATISPTVVNCPKETHTSKGGYLRLTITSISDSDAATNQRTIGTKVTIQGTAWVELYAWSVKLGGQVITQNTSKSVSVANWKTGHVLATKTLVFDNDSAGNLTLQAYVKQMFYYGMGVASRWNDPKFYQLKTADLVCSQLPRYTSFSTHTVDNTTLNTATIKWSAPDTVDLQEYSLDGGAWTTFTGSSYTLTGLSPGSTHKVQTRIRRQDSQLTTTSGELSFTLKSLPTSNTPSNINLGSKQTVSISSISYLTKWMCEIWDGSTKIKEDTNITTTSKELDISASTIVSGMLSRHTSDNEWNLTYKFKVVSNGITYNLTDRTAKITISTGQYVPTYNISSVSYAVTDATSNNITGSNQKVIKGISDIQYTIGAATPNGSATMSRYVVSTGDKSVSVNSASSMSASISDVSSKSFSVQAVDSRGRSTTVSKNYSTYIEYFKPTVTSYNIFRKDAVLANLVFNISGTFCNWSGLQVSNTITAITYQYKLKTASTYSSEISCSGITFNNGNFTLSYTGTGDLINTSNEYDIKINIYDRLSSVSFNVSIGTGKALLWRDIANTRIGIGKKPTCALDVNGAIKSSNDITASGNINCTDNYVTGVLYLNGTNIKTFMSNTYLSKSGGSINGTLTVTGGVTMEQSLHVKGHIVNGVTFSTNPTNSFQSTLFGSNNYYHRFKVIRSGVNNDSNFPMYSSGLAFTGGDTHGLLMTKYDSADVIVGAGSSNKLNWTKHLAFKDDIIAMGDYVVSQGTSGIWTYRKWNSGVSECWGQPNITTYSGNGTVRMLVSTSDSYKSYYWQIDVPLPSGVFTSVNCVNATAIDNGTGVSTCCVESWSATTFRMVTWGTNTSANNGKPSIHVFGRWK